MWMTPKRFLYFTLLIFVLSTTLLLLVGIPKSEVQSSGQLSESSESTQQSPQISDATLAPSPTPTTTAPHGVSPASFWDAVMKSMSSLRERGAMRVKNDTDACPAHGVVYAYASGPLGHLMWEYAAAYVLGQRTGMQPYVHPDIRRVLDEVFVNLSVPAREMQHCPQAWNTSLHGNLLDSPNSTSIQVDFFTHYRGIEQLFEIITQHQPDIRREFKFHPHLVKHAQEVLLAARRSADTVYIGVHVRRTHYWFYLLIHFTAEARASYYERAMDVYRRKYKGAVFMVASDDIDWCRKNLTRNRTDIVLLNGTAAQDMATLSACNHTIIDYDTYGEWSAILAGGEAIVYRVTLAKFHTTTLLAYILNWTIRR